MAAGDRPVAPPATAAPSRHRARIRRSTSRLPLATAQPRAPELPGARWRTPREVLRVDASPCGGGEDSRRSAAAMLDVSMRRSPTRAADVATAIVRRRRAGARNRARASIRPRRVSSSCRARLAEATPRRAERRQRREDASAPPPQDAAACRQAHRRRRHRVPPPPAAAPLTVGTPAPAAVPARCPAPVAPPQPRRDPAPSRRHRQQTAAEHRQRRRYRRPRAPPPPVADDRGCARSGRSSPTTRRAIEGKDLALFRSIKPNLSREEERRLQDGFRAVTSQRVNLRRVASIGSGDEASVVVQSPRRRFEAGGRKQTTESQQTHDAGTHGCRLGHRRYPVTGTRRAHGRRTAAIWLMVVCRCRLAQHRPSAQEPYNLTAPVTNLATLFTDLFGPRGLVVDSLATLPGEQPHSRALQQRLSVQLQPVQHRAGQSARQRAAAVAGRRLHLSVRCQPRRLSAHDAELRTDPRRSRRHHRRAPRVARLCVSALHLRHRRRARSDSVPAVFTHDNASLLGGREDVVTTTNAIEATVSQSTTFVTARHHRSLRHVAGGAARQQLPEGRVRRDDSSSRHDQPADALLPAVGWRGRRAAASSPRSAARAASAIDGARKHTVRQTAVDTRLASAATCGCRPATR